MGVTNKSTLKELVDETTVIKNDLVNCRDNLKNNLSDKGVDVASVNKMQELVNSIPKLKVLPKEVGIGENLFILVGGWLGTYSTDWYLIGRKTCKINGSYRVHTQFTSEKYGYRVYAKHVHKRGNVIIDAKEFSTDDQSDVRALKARTDFTNAIEGDYFEIYVKTSTSSYSCNIFNYGISCGITYDDLL